MTPAFFFQFLPGAARLCGVLCCSLLVWSLGSSRACAEDTLSRFSRALTFETLVSSESHGPEWAFTEETMPGWQTLEKGLELGLFPARQNDVNFEVVVLRIDPASFVFSVHTVSQSGRAFSLGEWASQHGLVAVINASMYLPDGVTSTGYLRAGEIVNNGRIVSKFGAFFVAEPVETAPLPSENGEAGESVSEPGELATESRDLQTLSENGVVESGSVETERASLRAESLPSVSPVRMQSETSSILPEADILDRSVDDWESLLPRYRMVVQNYRLISADRRLLWTPGGPRHSIAAVGKDGAGRILFFLCREPLTGVEFGNLLLALPIDVHVVMYAEGGSQAGLFLDSMTRRQTWMGRYLADIWTSGNLSAPLPNVIGIRRRS